MDRLARPAGALWRDCGDCVVAGLVEQPDPRRLNGIARVIWLALDHPATVSDLAAIVDEFDLAIDSTTVAAAAADLVAAGVLRTIA